MEAVWRQKCGRGLGNAWKHCGRTTGPCRGPVILCLRRELYCPNACPARGDVFERRMECVLDEVEASTQFSRVR